MPFLSKKFIAGIQFAMQLTKPKICVVSATPLTLHFFFTEHLRQMSKWADVTIVYNKEYNEEVQPIDAPVAQHHVMIKRRIALVYDFLGLLTLIRFFQRRQFDMVITLVPKAGLLAMIAAFLVKTPVRLVIFQGEIWSSRKGLSRRLLKMADGLTARLSTETLAVSHSEREYLIKEGVVRFTKINVLGAGSIAGVNTSRFKPNKVVRVGMRDQLGIPQAATVLLFLGRITRDKGVFELLSVFSKLTEAKSDVFLLLVGPDEGGITEQLKSMVSLVHRDKLKVVGFTREPETFMATADILCLPSYREGFGMVALEAAACEVPSVGTDIHGLQDAVIHKETGFLVPLGSEDALLNALTVLINSPDLRQTYGKHGRSRVEKDFKAKTVIDVYVKYFQTILRNKLNSLIAK